MTISSNVFKNQSAKICTSRLYENIKPITLPSTVESETTGPADSCWQPENMHADTNTLRMSQRTKICILLCVSDGMIWASKKCHRVFKNIHQKAELH